MDSIDTYPIIKERLESLFASLESDPSFSPCGVFTPYFISMFLTHSDTIEKNYPELSNYIHTHSIECAACGHTFDTLAPDGASRRFNHIDGDC